MKRIASIDIFRAITMLLMLWVNDFAGMSGLPHWLHHAASGEDMMGFSDLIFPSFLFCMGMAVPLSVGAREKKGDGTLSQLIHIVLRSFALIVMGVFDLNVTGHWFEILMVVGFFLVWNDWRPSEEKMKWQKPLFIALRAAGAMLLIGLLIYARPVTTGWWGILGLIGWAYLFSSLVYLLLRKLPWALLAAWVLVIAAVILSKGAWRGLGRIPGGWTHIGLSMSGVMCTVLMFAMRDKGWSKRFFATASCIALLLAGAGAVCHNWWIVSKISATPTWMFYCLALDMLLIGALHFIADVQGKTSWANAFKAAGTATLTCYTLPYLWYPLRDLTGIYLPSWCYNGVPGLLKAALFSYVIVLLAQLLGRLGLKLKL